jgi:hypothetical protein
MADGYLKLKEVLMGVVGVNAITPGDMGSPPAYDGPEEARRGSNPDDPSSRFAGSPASHQEEEGDGQAAQAEGPGKARPPSVATHIKESFDPITSATMAEEQVAASKALVAQQPETALLTQANVTLEQVAGLYR